MIESGDAHFAQLILALTVLTITALVVERILNFVFEDVGIVREFLERKPNRKKSKPFVSLMFCFAISLSFQIDGFSAIFPQADMYLPDGRQVHRIAEARKAVDDAKPKSVEWVEAKLKLAMAERPTPTLLGMILTSFLLAGGSAGLMGLTQETLGMSRAVRKSKEMARLQANANQNRPSGRAEPPKAKVGGQKGFAK